MIAILTLLVLTAGLEHEPKQCAITLLVTKTDPTAARSEQREKVVGEPRVVTLFGRTACFRFGGVRPEPGGILGPGVGVLVSGCELSVTPTRQRDGERGLGLDLELAPAGAERGSRVWVWTDGPIVRRRLRGPEGLWIEVTATAVAAEK